MSEHLHITPVDPSDSLVLEPVANGGWVVWAKFKTASDMHVMNSPVGAFSSTKDMLTALANVWGFELAETNEGVL